jgi:hypothetical protein
MRNDTYIKVTCVNNERNDEFHFDFYNKERKLVGTVQVNEKGQLKWYIFNKRDEDVFLLDQGIEKNILYAVSYIYGAPVENTIEFINEANMIDENRWDRALDFIEKRGLYVNYKKDQYYNDDYANAKMR